MKLIKKIVGLIYETVVILGFAGVLMYGYERIFENGIAQAIILFIIGLALVIHKDITSSKEKSGE